MEKQYCKVGSSHPLDEGVQGITLLETQLQHFMRKASEAARADSRMKDFFESKILKIQKQLQEFA
ncbi:hypothetical protein [Robiginitalea marina]|uniref:Uncharacterized protein n=1 Tax=Robiginitalea marina TaxID=2954105 RepID=A0ABT1AWV1_9FLAO|nr:hypothetical protein [Robiginitalea marina]MCO5724095.1 hypothetical protein [Robiginitalea marina]